jgi:hypothetical protein
MNYRDIITVEPEKQCTFNLRQVMGNVRKIEFIFCRAIALPYS